MILLLTSFNTAKQTSSEKADMCLPQIQDTSKTRYGPDRNNRLGAIAVAAIQPQGMDRCWPMMQV